MNGVAIGLSGFMGPMATKINQSAVLAYQNVIYPGYKSDRYPYPDYDDFQKFVKRIDLCTKLVNLSITLCDDDNEENIQRYENLIFLEQQAIDGCSYDSEYFDYDPYNQGPHAIRTLEEATRRDGNFPDSANNRYYFIDYTLNDTAKSIRRQRIAGYKTKIRAIKDAKEKREREAAQKRFNDYWAEHAELKASLESEKNNLTAQISAINAASDKKVATLNKEIAAIPGKEEIDNIAERIQCNLQRIKQRKMIPFCHAFAHCF